MSEITQTKTGNQVAITVRNGKAFARFDIVVKNRIMHINHFTGAGAGLLARQGLKIILQIADKEKLGIDAHLLEDERLIKLAKLSGFKKAQNFNREKYDGLVQRFTLKKRPRK